MLPSFTRPLDPGLMGIPPWTSGSGPGRRSGARGPLISPQKWSPPHQAGEALLAECSFSQKQLPGAKTSTCLPIETQHLSK